jgi:hypothetical protein
MMFNATFSIRKNDRRGGGTVALLAPRRARAGVSDIAVVAHKILLIIFRLLIAKQNRAGPPAVRAYLLGFCDRKEANEDEDQDEEAEEEEAEEEDDGGS